MIFLVKTLGVKTDPLLQMMASIITMAVVDGRADGFLCVLGRGVV
jgi:hypothetical protein